MLMAPEVDKVGADEADSAALREEGGAEEAASVLLEAPIAEEVKGVEEKCLEHLRAVHQKADCH